MSDQLAFYTAMSVSNKERVMPKVYHPIIDGQRCTMTNMAGMSEAEAREYCEGKFGKHRFGGFASE